MLRCLTTILLNRSADARRVQQPGRSATDDSASYGVARTDGDARSRNA